MSSSKGKKTQQRSAIADVVAREYTIHLHKRVRSNIPVPSRRWLKVNWPPNLEGIYPEKKNVLTRRLLTL